MTTTAPIAPPAPVPEHLEAELAVLGALLLDPEGADEVFELLTPDHFLRDAHRHVFRAMLALQADGKPIDVVTLQGWLAGRGELERVGGSEFLAQLLAVVPTAAHVVHHAGLIRDRALERRLLAAGQEIQLAVRDRVAEGPELAALAERVVLDASGDVIPGRPVALGDQLLRDVLEEIDRRISADNHVVGIGSNLVDLDELTAGWRAGYIVIGGRPSEGKTALSWYCAQVAAAAEQPVLYISLEMSREELVERALARMADIPLSQLHRGKVSDHGVARLVWAQGQMQHWPLWIDDAPDRTISSVRAVARRYRRQHRIAMVVLDYVQLLRPDRERDNEVQNVRTVSAGLKAMARDLGIPVMVCSQLNRTPELAKSDKPKLAHLRESGALEQDADVVVLLWNNPTHAELAKPPLTLLLAKQRNGPKGEVKVAYDRATGEFSNWSERADA